jgi:hypothetical protein
MPGSWWTAISTCRRCRCAFQRYRYSTAAAAMDGKAPSAMGYGAGCLSGRPCSAPPGRQLRAYTTSPAVASTLGGPPMPSPPRLLPCPQAALGVAPGLEFQSCSDAVGEALGADVMRSVKALLPDLLAAYPLLLYQGGCACVCVCLCVCVLCALADSIGAWAQGSGREGAAAAPHAAPPAVCLAAVRLLFVLPCLLGVLLSGLLQPCAGSRRAF